MMWNEQADGKMIWNEQADGKMIWNEQADGKMIEMTKEKEKEFMLEDQDRRAIIDEVLSALFLKLVPSTVPGVENLAEAKYLARQVGILYEEREVDVPILGEVEMTLLALFVVREYLGEQLNQYWEMLREKWQELNPKAQVSEEPPF